MQQEAKILQNDGLENRLFDPRLSFTGQQANAGIHGQKGEAGVMRLQHACVMRSTSLRAAQTVTVSDARSELIGTLSCVTRVEKRVSESAPKLMWPWRTRWAWSRHATTSTSPAEPPRTAPWVPKEVCRGYRKFKKKDDLIPWLGYSGTNASVR